MKVRFLAASAAAALMLSALTACSTPTSESTDTSGPTGTGSAPSAADQPYAGTTLTYWATNQGSSLDDDKAILQPELDKFKQQTGITVNLEVIPWSDMTNNTLQAAISGQGPDVVNIGNTNATTLQATNAFMPFDSAALTAIGGKDKFVASAWKTAGPAGKDPTSVPLYSQVYGLFYNKAMFAAAGLQPPTTWEDLVADAKTLTDPAKGTWGIVAPAGTVNVSMHIEYIFAAQNGGSPFLDDGTPDFVTQANIDAVKRYIDLMATDKVLNPSAAQYSDGVQATNEFATGKVGMYMAQTGNVNALAQQGMKPDQYGVVPVPAPAGGKSVGSFIAGTNISVFSFTQHKEAALEFVKFMTSAAEQEILNKAFRMISPVQGVPASAFAEWPELMQVWPTILQNNAIPMALVSTVSAYQTNVGGGIVALFAQAASGSPVTEDTIKTMLDEAQQKMLAAG
ncbi:MAG: sugar ABC transporter substrate-binding protein [Propionibacteriaceae bacterium]|jgi:multiple sugar transport system substrate-binding protein|nr:sugar ABC transporter substrate-binding protein [Propionibacteriaceae bacterium]